MPDDRQPEPDQGRAPDQAAQAQPLEQQQRTPRAGGASGANQGEGDRDAANRYNAGATSTARSGNVPGKARAAADALDGSEKAELDAAEAAGRSHAKGEDPAVKR